GAFTPRNMLFTEMPSSTAGHQMPSYISSMSLSSAWSKPDRNGYHQSGAAIERPSAKATGTSSGVHHALTGRISSVSKAKEVIPGTYPIFPALCDDRKQPVDLTVIIAVVAGDFQTQKPYLQGFAVLDDMHMRRLVPIQCVEPELVPMPYQQRRHFLRAQPSEQRRHVERAEAVMRQPAHVGVEEGAQVRHAVF